MKIIRDKAFSVTYATHNKLTTKQLHARKT